ncbi:hypothetical protein ABZX74_15665 [Streptomyces olivaceoviridis]|uniref:hypothetical protein n=1 Tax=Streptomyces olivaceoviridis TaxID=1921 RepID=UPI00339EF818
MHRYRTWNAAAPTTSAIAKVATGTSIKTMLQLATPSTRQIQLISWGYSFDAGPSSAGVVELLQTDVAATVTAHVASGVQPLDPNAPASLLTLGTSGTGYTATAEGTTTASRVLDAVEVAPSSSSAPSVCYSYQWMPDERPIIAVSKFLRIRATMGSSVNMLCWVCWDE